jgi:Fe-S-cluster containining protein
MLHGTLVAGERLVVVEFEARCTALTKEGRCSIYEERPLTCELYPLGGQPCLETIKRRRPYYALKLGLTK